MAARARPPMRSNRLVTGDSAYRAINAGTTRDKQAHRIAAGWHDARVWQYGSHVARLEYEWVPDREIGRVDADAASPLGPASVTACIVVRNEEATIARCIRSLIDVVDEVIVVHDGECDDRTVEIAASFGCRVFVAPRWGHCEHHLPFTYQQARGEWLLTIDADEFLSEPMRRELRTLARSSAAGGIEFRWRLWNGREYITTEGPYKRVLCRRQAVRMIGVIHSRGEVDGLTERVRLDLEHQPPYNNFAVARIATKWRQRARSQAREYLMDLNALPRFNYPGQVRWTKRRVWTNRLAPVLIVPAALHTFLFVVSELRTDLGLGRAIRFALTQAVYRGMVTAYIAALAIRGGPDLRPSTERPRLVTH
jgi:glycosyltransferase involved in cell wall biosynthesis